MLFKNKSFLVKVIDEPKKNSDPLPTPEEIEAANQARADAQVKTGVTIILGIGAVIGTYMATDTFRQIAVHTAKTLIK
jgi:predicted flap endonuclease-1-like 5' DNA nuclease